MTTQYRQSPTYEVPLSKGDVTTSTWYRWFQAIDQGTPPSSEVAVRLGTSPYNYTAPSKGFVIVNGGTVSFVQFSRSGQFYTTGQISGVFPVSFNDQLRITYSVAPTVTFVPQ